MSQPVSFNKFCSKTGAARNKQGHKFQIARSQTWLICLASWLRMCEANLAQENGQLQCFFMVKHVTVWQPKHDRATKRDTNILWSNQYEHCLFKNTLLFVQKYAVVCSKTCFKILVLKCFKRCVSFYALKTYLLV